MSEFGKWRKRNKQDTWEPKDGHPYVVARQERDGNALYIATRSGDNPETLREIHLGKKKGMNEKGALRHGQHVCEEHWRQQQQKGLALAERR